jgi:hypothetical protein
MIDRERIEEIKATFLPPRFPDPDIAAIPELKPQKVKFISTPENKPAAKNPIVNAKPKRGRPFGSVPSNKTPGLSAAAIIDGFRAGRSMTQQAMGFGVQISTASHCLHDALKQSDELKMQYFALLVCACGAPKMPHFERCKVCRRKA